MDVKNRSEACQCRVQVDSVYKGTIYPFTLFLLLCLSVYSDDCFLELPHGVGPFLFLLFGIVYIAFCFFHVVERGKIFV